VPFFSTAKKEKRSDSTQSAQRQEHREHREEHRRRWQSTLRLRSGRAADS